MLTNFKVIPDYMEHRRAREVNSVRKDGPVKNVRYALSFLRLSLSGAILGAAVFGLVAPMFGVEPHSFLDGIGAVTGFSTVAVVKAAHLL